MPMPGRQRGGGASGRSSMFGRRRAPGASGAVTKAATGAATGLKVAKNTKNAARVAKALGLGGGAVRWLMRLPIKHPAWVIGIALLGPGILDDYTDIGPSGRERKAAKQDRNQQFLLNAMLLQDEKDARKATRGDTLRRETLDREMLMADRTAQREMGMMQMMGQRSMARAGTSERLGEMALSTMGRPLTESGGLHLFGM